MPYGKGSGKRYVLGPDSRLYIRNYTRDKRGSNAKEVQKLLPIEKGKAFTSKGPVYLKDVGLFLIYP